MQADVPRASRGPLPAGIRVVLDPGVAVRRGGRVVLGGSPWRVARIAPAAQPFLDRLRRAGAAGAEPTGPGERDAARALVDRGLAHLVPPSRPSPWEVAVVVPAYQRADLLRECLRSLAGTPADGGGEGRAGPVAGDAGRVSVVDVVVVDDGSSNADEMARVVTGAGARLVRHAGNRGPAAARNTGTAATDAPLVAFVDSDCRVGPGWLAALAPLFDDPQVGAVAPRVRSRSRSRELLARHEDARSALDMGRRRELVRPGARLGFLPSAALVVRRAAVGTRPFDPELRLGEDVDLVWRLADAGWHVRYEPAATVWHEARTRPATWARRRYEYGTSAADLDRRHPGRLAPARVSGWNVLTLGLLVAGRPGAAGAVSAVAATLLARRLGARGGGAGVAVTVVVQGVVADAAALGHALRREWWPVGWAALALAGRSRVAGAAAAAMVGPLVLEWVRQRPEVDPVRYVLLRIAEDAAYGSGVLASAVAGGRPRALLPVVRLPRITAPRSWSWLGRPRPVSSPGVTPSARRGRRRR